MALDSQKQGLKGQSPEPPLLHIRACLRGEPLDLILTINIHFGFLSDRFSKQKILNTYTILPSSITLILNIYLDFCKSNKENTLYLDDLPYARHYNLRFVYFLPTF